MSENVTPQYLKTPLHSVDPAITLINISLLVVVFVTKVAAFFFTLVVLFVRFQVYFFYRDLDLTSCFCQSGVSLRVKVVGSEYLGAREEIMGTCSQEYPH